MLGRRSADQNAVVRATGTIRTSVIRREQPSVFNNERNVPVHDFPLQIRIRQLTNIV
jgi:hypothetical protein